MTADTAPLAASSPVAGRHAAAGPAAMLSPAAARAIGFWLLGCAGMVFAMAIIGAITRLTESGLSITEWRPITGTLPPLSEAQWLAEFEKYRQIPEYQLINRGMSLAEFKYIYFWEWFHRLWGRLIGVVFLVPMLVFWARGMIPRALAPRLVGLFLLGGLQGALGWYMVQSGLVDRVDVSHYRLAAHLGVAFVIYAALIWVALDVLDPAPRGHLSAGAGSLRRHGRVALALIAVTVVWGAFVAGLDAGFAYNSWPLMGGHFAPPEMTTLSPLWLNLLENTVAVQFTHRWLAILAAAVVLWLAWRAWTGVGTRTGRRLAVALAVAVTAQVAMGIATLLSHVWIPVAVAHQGGAFVVVGLLVWLLHELKAPRTVPAGGAAAAYPS